MKNNRIHSLKDFYILWATQTLSQLGSAMTNFALTLWLYQETGSALQTALLSICSYVPYVLTSIFAGALSDRWDKKRTMLACDTLAAGCSAAVFGLLKGGVLCPWHLYVLNAVNGLMNTVQNPASEVAATLVTILHPVLATSLYALGGMDAVIVLDLGTFAAAFCTLLFWVRIPCAGAGRDTAGGTLLQSAGEGLSCLYENRLVLLLILFLAGVNLVASAFDAVLPAFVLPRENGGETVLGIVTSFAGIAMLAGSLLASALPEPKDRVRVIVVTMLFSLTTDNFLLSLSRTPALWGAAQVLGYLPVPIMNTNLDVIVRRTIPIEMQGRVYACRNALQFFTIPIGYVLGGWLVDAVCEPFMARASDGLAVRLFGRGQGSGAAMTIFFLGILGLTVCLAFAGILRRYRAPDGEKGGFVR